MKNYICINDQKVELTQEQTEQIRASFGLPAIQLKDGVRCEVYVHRMEDEGAAINP